MNRVRQLMPTILLACVIGYATGCGATRTILVPATGVYRIGPDVYGHIYAKVGGEWVLGDNIVHLPEGHFVTHLD